MVQFGKIKSLYRCLWAIGFGAVFGSKWCYGAWPASWINRNIAVLEFYPIMLSLLLWGSEMQNRCILFFTDNEAKIKN